MLDPIADMLTRIRNAQAAGHASVSLRSSKLKFIIAGILEKEGFVDRVEKIKDEKNLETLTVWLKYTKVSQTQKVPAIREISRVSKQGCRIYVKNGDIKKVKNGYGIAIVSTSQGVMTGGEAFAKGLGGEYICKVW
ncbi:MAG: 30S ribosomal protein S8 [Candidatus Moranbacteria bacterium]|nr:30S ribosomal protein S8 [Candidatus Moranbacteria bacterium]